jgi:Histidine kinase-, DNA gyrase B-, and HSP90-like ATPase
VIIPVGSAKMRQQRLFAFELREPISHPSHPDLRAPKFPAARGFGRFSSDPSVIIRSTQKPSGGMNRKTEPSSQARGKLKIGDDWNAITIIALSQTSPLKAIAELVENSIDAKARTVTITRGREHRRHFLSIRDDGKGVPRDNAGRPDFRYVATAGPNARTGWHGYYLCCSCDAVSHR